MASPDLQSKVNQLTAKIEGDLTSLVDEIERLKLRPIGRQMHACIVQCYDKWVMRVMYMYELTLNRNLLNQIPCFTYCNNFCTIILTYNVYKIELEKMDAKSKSNNVPNNVKSRPSVPVPQHNKKLPTSKIVWTVPCHHVTKMHKWWSHLIWGMIHVRWKR